MAAINAACAATRPFLAGTRLQQTGVSAQGSQLVAAAACTGLLREQLLQSRLGRLSVAQVDPARATVHLKFDSGAEILARGIPVGLVHSEPWRYAEFVPTPSAELRARVESASSWTFARPLVPCAEALEQAKLWRNRLLVDTLADPSCAYVKIQCLTLGQALNANCIAVRAREVGTNFHRWCLAIVGDECADSRTLGAARGLSEIRDLIWEHASAMRAAMPDPLASICVAGKSMGFRAIRVNESTALLASGSIAVTATLPLALVVRTNSTSRGGSPPIQVAFLHHDSQGDVLGDLLGFPMRSLRMPPAVKR